MRTKKSKPKREILDPRQVAFLKAYYNPASKTFANALQTGLAVGFSREYSENITGRKPSWFVEAENVGRERRIQLAERHLDETLKLAIEVPAMGAFGPIIDKKTKKPVMVKSMEVVKQKTKVTEFVLERLNRKDYGKEGPKIGLQFNFGDRKSNYA